MVGRTSDSGRIIGAVVAVSVILGGCDRTVEPTGLEVAEASLAGRAGVTNSAQGGGHFLIGSLDVQFAFNAIQKNVDGDAKGHARHSVVLEGELIEFHTRVTCASFDQEEGRAWIGGVITKNASTHPAFTGAVNQPGRDIWFRVVDYGQGAKAGSPDRSTFVGFEGSAGLETSREYCDTRIWPADDARTNPVTEGNIQVLGR